MPSQTFFQCIRNTSMLFLYLLLASRFVFSQEPIDSWKSSFDQRTRCIDFASFEIRFPFTASGVSPTLKAEVPSLDDLEMALQAWGENKAIENMAMEVLMENDALRLQQLNALYGLYKADVQNHFLASTLPRSFVWLPALLNQFNHAHSDASQKSGLWSNQVEIAIDRGLNVNANLDERFIPDKSTEAAVATLVKLQRRFPDSPHRVLVAYVKGMAFATRWTGKPGYDAALDEWLALYKVISRMMVNVELEDRSLDWIQLMGEWKPVPCDGNVRRSDLCRQLSMTEAELKQLIPWWKGSSIGCEELNSRNVRLPLRIAETSPVTQPSPEVAKTEAVLQTIAEEEAYSEGIKCLLHEVKEGDTLWNISKRYPGTTPEWIAEINEIKDYIRIGQVLCIPRIP